MHSRNYLRFLCGLLVLSFINSFGMKQSSSAQASAELIQLIRNHKEAPIITTLPDYYEANDLFARGALDIFLNSEGPRQLKAIEAKRLSTDQELKFIRDLIRKGENPSTKDAFGKSAIDYVDELTISDADRAKLLQELGVRSILPRALVADEQVIEDMSGPLQTLKFNSRLPKRVQEDLKVIVGSRRLTIGDLKILRGVLSNAYDMWHKDPSYQRLSIADKKDIEQKFEQIKNYFRNAIILGEQKGLAASAAPQAQAQVQTLQPLQRLPKKETQEEELLREYYGQHPELQRPKQKEIEELRKKQQAEQERGELIRQIEELRKQKAERERAAQIRKIEEMRRINAKILSNEKLTTQEMQVLEEAKKALPEK